MNIAFVASEVVPFAKTGGLADVAGSLPIELTKLGVKTKQVQIANLARNVEASTRTIQDTYSKASKFAGENRPDHQWITIASRKVQLAVKRHPNRALLDRLKKCLAANGERSRCPKDFSTPSIFPTAKTPPRKTTIRKKMNGTWNSLQSAAGKVYGWRFSGKNF